MYQCLMWRHLALVNVTLHYSIAIKILNTYKSTVLLLALENIKQKAGLVGVGIDRSMINNCLSFYLMLKDYSLNQYLVGV